MFCDFALSEAASVNARVLAPSEEAAERALAANDERAAANFRQDLGRVAVRYLYGEALAKAQSEIDPSADFDLLESLERARSLLLGRGREHGYASQQNGRSGHAVPGLHAHPEARA